MSLSPGRHLFGASDQPRRALRDRSQCRNRAGIGFGNETNIHPTILDAPGFGVIVRDRLVGTKTLDSKTAGGEIADFLDKKMTNRKYDNNFIQIQNYLTLKSDTKRSGAKPICDFILRYALQ
jgi:hypothetical protein